MEPPRPRLRDEGRGTHAQCGGGGVDERMDDLRENMQLEKLRALKPVADLSDNQGPQRKPGLSSTKQDPKALGKEIQEEVT